MTALMIVGLFAFSVAIARGAHLATDHALRLFAYAPGHRAYTVTRMVTFAVLFTTMYAVLLQGLTDLAARYEPPALAMRESTCTPGCQPAVAVPLR